VFSCDDAFDGDCFTPSPDAVVKDFRGSLGPNSLGPGVSGANRANVAIPEFTIGPTVRLSAIAGRVRKIAVISIDPRTPPSCNPASAASQIHRWNDV
jgi:hypothetical protein